MTLFRKRDTPVLSPASHIHWASGAVFNAGAWCDGTTVHLFFRAIPAGYNRIEIEGPDYFEGHFGYDNYVSYIGLATSTDGIHFEIDPKPVLAPDTDADRYGCEDPRISPLGDRFAMTYTALREPAFGDEMGVQIGLATTRDFRTFEKHGAISPPIRDKDAVLFPRPIGGRLGLIHRIVPDIQLAWFDSEAQLLKPGDAYWHEHVADLDRHVILRPEYPWECKKIGAGPPPIETPEGWLLIYHGVDAQHVYRGGAALLDLDDPSRVIARLPYPILEPSLEWELHGDVPNVVFPQGAAVRGDELLLYYGAADRHVGLATASMRELLDALLATRNAFRMPRIFMGGTKVHEEPFATMGDEAVPVQRLNDGDPVLEPHPDHPWEDRVVLNPAAVLVQDPAEIDALCATWHLDAEAQSRLSKGACVMLYRAQGTFSRHGHAPSSLGLALFTPELELVYRHPEPILYPDAPFHDLGVEDPRCTRVGDTYFLYYTGYGRTSGHNGSLHGRVRICLATTKDFKNWALHGPLEGPLNDVPNKNAVLLPEPVNGQWILLHRPLEGDYPFAMHWAVAEDPDGPWTSKGLLMASHRFESYPLSWLGAAGVPEALGDGRFLTLYHQGHVGYDRRRMYNLSATVLDFTQPNPVGKRIEPVLKPTGEREQAGDPALGVDNVVFSCANYRFGNDLIVPYAGADSRIFGARYNVQVLLDALAAEPSPSTSA